ncbi:MAG: sigma-70 family RNA polymerase sigma factor [Anaerolineales bacterium]|nr:sigma-70 family RNA polymerase sigma factor [Anaerolineales bacterium]
MDEKPLIDAARRGDVGSFNRLVLSYQSMVYNFAYRILGDGDAAADATQDAFISAFKGIGKFRGGSLKAWLMRIVTNACYDQLRLKQRRPATSLDALLELDSAPLRSLTDPGESPEQYAMRQELSRTIQVGMGTLPPEQRVALILCDVQGLSYQEIAEVTDASLGTVKSRLSRARGKMRDFLLEQRELLPSRYRLKNE